MRLPEEFAERFERTFYPNYRIRWSDARQEWHVEQKVMRGIADGFVDMKFDSLAEYKKDYDDRLRARDGYVLTFAVRPGTSMPCETCGTRLSVPVRRFEVIQCPVCTLRGRTRMDSYGYFPLDDSLIDRLKKIDVFNGGNERVKEAVKRRNEYVLAQADLELRRFIEPQVRERYNRLVGIPQWGRSPGAAGEQPYWDRNRG